MRHLKSGRKLKRTASHKRALLRNLASSLIVNKRLITTEAKAKELRSFAEKIVTRAKTAYYNERNNRLPNGQVYDIHNRRLIASDIQDKGIIQNLMDEIAPAVINRPGGYTRIVKIGYRRGDAARTAIIEFVDFGAEQDGVVSNNKKKTTKTAKSKTPKAPKVVAPKVEVKAEPAPEVKEEAKAQAEEAPEVVADATAPEVETAAPATEEETENKE